MTRAGNGTEGIARPPRHSGRTTSAAEHGGGRGGRQPRPSTSKAGQGERQARRSTSKAGELVPHVQDSQEKLETTTEEEAEAEIYTRVAGSRRPSDGGKQLPLEPVLYHSALAYLRVGGERHFFGLDRFSFFFSCGEDGSLGPCGMGMSRLPAIPPNRKNEKAQVKERLTY